MTDAPDTDGPDLQHGVPAADLVDGAPLAGRVGDARVMLVRRGSDVFAVGAKCTHYGGNLADGLVVGDTVRCPLHHACFSLRTGEAMSAPAFDPIERWQVEHEGDRIFVREKLGQPDAAPAKATSSNHPASIVIVGGGAAGFAAAEMLRREGYAGSLTMISADSSAPYDRPNISKDFLTGDMPADWLPLRPDGFYAEQRIELLLDTTASSIDVVNRRVQLANGAARPFDRLLITTGAAPVRPPIPGASGNRVHYVRSLKDGQALVDATKSASRALIVGAGFIGLEVAAELRKRNVTVDVVAPEVVVLERVVGRQLGDFVRALHETNGVVFHLGESVARIEDRSVTTTRGQVFDVDVVVMAAGVRPNVALAEPAGLALDRGIVVNELLETSAAGIFAAGDVARWTDPWSGDRVRIEHWVVAERQGQAAARNMLGQRIPFRAVPFFWSQHYDVTIRYVGHAESWDAITIDGRIEDRDCAVTYSRAGRRLAMATIARDRSSLRMEADLEAMLG